ncbi:MAG: peptide-methionine (R)-S-oxide reductase MsrB [Acidobacteriota bacterium]
MSDQDEKWKDKLSPEQYHVLREAGTERAFTGKYWDEKAPGTYKCAACGAPLYSSKAKYDSGSGWPSFFEAVNPEAVKLTEDTSHGMRRIELTCAECDSHLGHLFPDGPQPTGMRHCINSCSLDLEKDE